LIAARMRLLLLPPSTIGRGGRKTSLCRAVIIAAWCDRIKASGAMPVVRPDRVLVALEAYS
jgi:hypothetical protein